LEIFVMKSVISRVFFSALMIGVMFTSINAQPMTNIFGMTEVTLADYMPTDVTYDPSIPTPKDVLGFEVGHRHVRHDQLVSYMYAVAEASDRVTIQEYARTYGYRPLLLLTITSPENHGRIDEIRTNHVKLTDPNASGDLNIANMPLVVWQGFSVHGNEPSGANASLLTLYYMAAAQGPAIDRMLNETVMLLDPSINPDGLDRFAHWANMHVGKNKIADPNHREHLEVWPNGRTNHYWFDLNRDYMPLQHPESRGRLVEFHNWKPNIYNDFHEMGTNSSFFFQPGIPSRNHPLTPAKAFELHHKIAEFHAEQLDGMGSLYYTKESFDDFYIGKGSTYPDINGSIGILYEQGSSRGHIQDSQFGLVTFPFTIKNQFSASVSTMKAAVELREDLLGHQREFYQSAMREASAAPIKAYVFGDEYDPSRNYHLLDMLKRHQIQVYELGRELTAGEYTFKPGSSYVVPTSQPQFRLITALFETRTTFTDSLFYDVSTWTLPFAFNLPYAELQGRTWNSSLLGSAIGEPARPQGTVHGDSNYAFAYEWDSYYAPRMTNALLKAGVKLMVSSLEFETAITQGTKKFTYGTIMVPMGIQSVSSQEIKSLLRKHATEDAVQVYALGTGYSTGGIDLGSPNFSSLRAPSTMILAGDGASGNDVGEIWHLFDQRWDMELSMVEIDRFNGASLDKYNTIIMVNGGYSGISDGAVDKLRRWVSGGGTLILHRGAVSWAQRAGLTGVKYVSSDDEDSTDMGMAKYTEYSAERGAQGIGGSIFKVNIDTQHPLFYGYRRSWMPVFKNNTQMMEAPENRYAMPMQFDKTSPLLSGYSNAQNVERIKGAAGTVVGGIGSGRVIMMTENPAFRAFWFGTNKLLANSIFFGHTISGGATTR
jgi:hypothetical protein